MVKNCGVETILDMVKLSDAFRRHAEFTDADDMKKIVEIGRRIAVQSTYYYPEYPDMPGNRRVDQNIKGDIMEIADIAHRLNIDTVILPLAGDQRSWIAQRIRGIVKTIINPQVKISLQKGPYSIDLSHLGAIDKGINTVLDDGVRGLVNIKPSLRRSWDI